MLTKELQENWQVFLKSLEENPSLQDEQINTFVKRYMEQNVAILNDVMTTSVENLKKLQDAKSINDVICTQARFTNELTKKLTLSAQRFLNASLGHITDYNEWLKAHCDLATD